MRFSQNGQNGDEAVLHSTLDLLCMQPTVWNRLPQTIRLCDSSNSFKTLLEWELIMLLGCGAKLKTPWEQFNLGITECSIRQINCSMCWWVRRIVTRGFSGDLMETSVEVFLMSIDINRVNSYWTNVFEVYNDGYLELFKSKKPKQLSCTYTINQAAPRNIGFPWNRG